MTKVRTNDGVEIAYRVVGNGPCPLVLMHGWGGAGSGHSWSEVLKYLDPSGLRLIAVDLRGHGQSGRPTSGFDLDRFAKDILAVADDAKVDRFIAVGYSMSGRWTQWMACRMPARVAAQILIGPVPATPLSLTDHLIDGWIRDAQDRQRFDQFIGQFTKERLAPEILDAYFRDASGASPQALKETLVMCRTGDFSSALPETRVPTLVVGGSADPLFSPNFLRDEIIARIPRARLVVLDCGHEIPVEKPVDTARLIEAFVAGLAFVKQGDGAASSI